MTFLSERMKNRAAVQAADLYVLLQREFRRRQSPECQLCYAQVPYRVDRIDANSANWEMILPPHCPYGCQAIMEELVSEFQSAYDLMVEARAGRA